MSIFDTLKKGKEIFVDAREALKENVWDKISPVDSAEEIQQQRQQSMLPSAVKDIQTKQAMEQGMVKIGNTYVDPLFSGGMKKIVGSTVKNVTPIVAKEVAQSKVFQGFNDLSTHVLEKLKGVGDTSEKFVLDTIQNVKGKLGVKQPEQNIYINALFDTVEGGRVNAKLFADRVKQDLLPLKIDYVKEGNQGKFLRYEEISLPQGQRGNIAQYDEHIYNSPIKTSAGSVHFGSRSDNYFGHTRVEDMADNSTRRVIEVQSDLFQKGRLESEKIKSSDGYPIMSVDETRLRNNGWTEEQISRATNRYENRDTELIAREKDIEKLSPYENIWHERLIREEVKQAAIDGKTKLQFPTGETAMRIEGLGTHNQWYNSWLALRRQMDEGVPYANRTGKVEIEDLKVGKEISQGPEEFDSWIVTEVLGDGKFKAIPASTKPLNNNQLKMYSDNKVVTVNGKTYMNHFEEAFDVSGKIDQNNPIYKFYESEVGKYLQKKYNATQVTDAQGVKWWEMTVDPSVANQPVKAFAGVPFMAGVKSLFTDTEQSGTNEDGSTWKGNVPSMFNSMRGKPITYERTDAPQPIVPAQEEGVAPKVIQTVTDIHGPYDTLESGTTVRPVREKLKGAIESVYEKVPSIEPGVIEALLMKESSMGTNSSNKNPDIGKYAWLVGMTKIAKKELIRNGFNPDLDTMEGAIEAAARYWDLKDDTFDNAMDAYNHWYSSGKLTAEQLQEFSDMMNYYSHNRGNFAKM